MQQPTPTEHLHYLLLTLPKIGDAKYEAHKKAIEDVIAGGADVSDWRPDGTPLRNTPKTYIHNLIMTKIASYPPKSQKQARDAKRKEFFKIIYSERVHQEYRWLQQGECKLSVDQVSTPDEKMLLFLIKNRLYLPDTELTTIITAYIQTNNPLLAELAIRHALEQDISVVVTKERFYIYKQQNEKRIALPEESKGAANPAIIAGFIKHISHHTSASTSIDVKGSPAAPRTIFFKQELQKLAKNYQFSIKRLDDQFIVSYTKFPEDHLEEIKSQLQKITDQFRQALTQFDLDKEAYELEFRVVDNTQQLIIIPKSYGGQPVGAIVEKMAQFLEAVGSNSEDSSVRFFIERPSQVRATLFAIQPGAAASSADVDNPKATITCRVQ